MKSLTIFEISSSSYISNSFLLKYLAAIITLSTQGNESFSIFLNFALYIIFPFPVNPFTFTFLSILNTA